ncbi:MAG: hypothetical protein WHV66_03035 [Anaerolineales bacterium]
MKILSKFLVIGLITSVVILAFPAPVFAQGPDDGDGQVVFGGTYKLASGKTLDGDLVVFGSVATVENGATVQGDVVSIGGTMEVDGKIEGDVVAIGGVINLKKQAVVEGSLININAVLQREEGSVVRGQITTEFPDNLKFNFNMLPFTTPANPQSPLAPGSFLRLALDPIGNILGMLLRVLAMAALAVLVSLFAQRPTERVAQAIVDQPVIVGGLGLLTLVVAPALVLVLAITILLAPLALLGVILLAIAVVFGWIAMGYEVGRRIAVSFKSDWTMPVSAGLGTLILTLVVSLIGYLPCIGWIAPFLVIILSLGGVLISRFGISGFKTARTPPTSPEPPFGTRENPIETLHSSIPPEVNLVETPSQSPLENTGVGNSNIAGKSETSFETPPKSKRPSHKKGSD